MLYNLSIRSPLQETIQLVCLLVSSRCVCENLFIALPELGSIHDCTKAAHLLSTHHHTSSHVQAEKYLLFLCVGSTSKNSLHNSSLKKKGWRKEKTS